MNKNFLMFLAVMMISLFVSVPVFAAKHPKITSKEMPCYFISAENKEMNTVYFIGNSDVPYLSLADCGEIFSVLMRNVIHEDDNINFGLSFSKNGETGILTRTDGDPYTMTVDCAADTITFWDYDAFVRPDEKRVLLDVLSAGDPKSDDDMNFFKRTDHSYERYGNSLILTRCEGTSKN